MHAAVWLRRAAVACANPTTGKSNRGAEKVSMTDSQGRVDVIRSVWLVAGILVIVAALWYMVAQVRGSAVQFPTKYQAVVLINGAVYFGRLAGYGGRDPVLTEVYYIVSQQDPTTKQVKNVLVKRGKELHEPDRMYVNPVQVLFVEPVGPNSKVAQLIAQASAQAGH